MRFFLTCLILLFIQGQPPVWVSSETNNFKIIASDLEASKYLQENAEFVKTWCSGRWYLKDVDFSKKCCLIAVKNKDEYFNLFQKTYPEISLNTQHNGKDVSAIWFWTDQNGWRNSVLPKYLTYVILHELELKESQKFCYTAKVGMACLNLDFESIKSKIEKIQKPTYSLDELLTVSSKIILDDKVSNYSKYENFEAQSAILTLFISKKQGKDGFSKFLYSKYNGSEEIFSDYESYQDKIIKGFKQSIVNKSYVLKVF